MGKIIDTKESELVQEFVKNAKEDFSEKIFRNRVVDIDVTECLQDESFTEGVRMKVTGSVETSSPTGKPRTYEYHAVVDVHGKKAEFASLEVLPLEG